MTILPVFLAAAAVGTTAAVGSLLVLAAVTALTIVSLTLVAYSTGRLVRPPFRHRSTFRRAPGELGWAGCAAGRAPGLGPWLGGRRLLGAERDQLSFERLLQDVGDGGAGRWVVQFGRAAILLDLGMSGSQIINQRAIYALRPDARACLTSVYMGSVFGAGAAGSAIAGALHSSDGWNGVTLFGIGLGLLAILLWAAETALTGRPGLARRAAQLAETQSAPPHELRPS